MESVDKVDEMTDSQNKSATPSNSDEKEQIEEEQIKEEEQIDEEQRDDEEPSLRVRTVVKTLGDGMDDTNKKAYDVLKTGDTTSFLKHVFTRDDGTQRSYAEMRYLYG